MEETIETPVIDPRNEEQLVQEALVTVFNRSNGILNDFSEGSVTRALIEGQAFSGSELLYFANKILKALVIEFLKNTGATRELGRKSSVQLTFTLTAAQTIAYRIDAGFEVFAQYQNKTYFFYTDEDVEIPPGVSSVVINATAAEIGEAYNLPAYTINKFTQPLNFLASVVNINPSLGGASMESEESFIRRALTQIRLTNLTSASDFEIRASNILGEGSVTKAIGLLSGNKISFEAGAVHLFLLNASGEPANPAQISKVYSDISSRLMLGTSLYVSPMELVEISGELIAKMQPGEDPEVVADELWAAFTDYFAPTKFTVGASVIQNEVEYILRLTGSIEYVDQLLLNGAIQNIPMLNDWTLPVAYSLSMSLVSDTGTTFSLVRGAGETLAFNPVE